MKEWQKISLNYEIDRLVRAAQRASYLGEQAILNSKNDKPLLAYTNAKMAHYWATLVIESKDKIAELF